MELSEDLLCLFTGRVEERNGSHVIELPEHEVDLGTLESGDVHRIAVFPPASNGATTEPDARSAGAPDAAEPPVAEGEVVDVEIENMGDQGDGIARVGPGYVIIVSETEVGERVAVEITETRENLAFADVVERYDQRR